MHCVLIKMEFILFAISVIKLGIIFNYVVHIRINIFKVPQGIVFQGYIRINISVSISSLADLSIYKLISLPVKLL